MIVQTAPEGAAHLIITQTDHAALAGQFAHNFGNETFSLLSPRAPVEYTAVHHDDGWIPIDALVEQDENSGLPYHLTDTPLHYLVKTSGSSPDFNEEFHPYSGILSSMHSYGLFNGRYGLSDKIFVDEIPESNKPAVELMLRKELDRQERLIEQLNKDEMTASWVSEVYLFHNYKLLQFFDTLALYFQMTHEQARGEASFHNVPREIGKDVTLNIHPLEKGLYRLSPYPFTEDELTVSYEGRYMHAQPIGTDLRPLFENSESFREHIKITAG